MGDQAGRRQAKAARAGTTAGHANERTHRRSVVAVVVTLAMAIGSVAAAFSPGGDRAVAAPGDGFEVTIAGPDLLALGDTGTYTIDVVNNDVATGEVLLNLDPYFTATIDVTNANGWTCAPAFRGIGCTIASLDAGASAPTLTIELTPTVAGPTYLFADAISGDIFGFGDISVTVTVESDLALSAPPATLTGTSYVAEFVVTNVGTGGSPFPGPVTVTINPRFTLEPGVASVDTVVGGTGWTCTDFVCTHPGPVPAAGSLPALVVSGTQVDSIFIAADLDTLDDNLSNNRASAFIALPGGDMTVFANPPFQPIAGSPTSFGFSVGNVGADSVSGAVSVAISTSLDNPTASGDDWTCGAFAAGSATCSTDTRTFTPFGPTSLISVSGTVPVGAATVNATATVSPSGSRSNNDTATIATPTVGPPPAVLAIDAATAMTSLSPGAPFDAQATVSNPSTTEAVGTVTVTYSSPNADVTATGDGWTCGFGSCTNPGPVPALGALPTISFTGTTSAFPIDSPFRVTVLPGGASDTISLPITLADLAVTVTPTPDEAIRSTSSSRSPTSAAEPLRAK